MRKTMTVGRGPRMRKAAAWLLCAALVVGCSGCASTSEGAGSTDAAADDPAASSEVLAQEDLVVDPADLSQGVAATVGDTQIGEAAVTAYIQNFRVMNNLLDERAWAYWILENAYTMDSLRAETLDYFVNRELIRQAAADLGIAVDEDAIDEKMAEDKESYATEERWQAYLTLSGKTEQNLRDDAEIDQLRQAIIDLELADAAASDEDVLSAVRLNNEEYANVESLDEVPDDVVQAARDSLADTAVSQAFSKYMNEYQRTIDVEKAGLPEDAPYVVDLKPYEVEYNNAAAASEGEGE